MKQLATIAILCSTLAYATDDLQFSLGVKYWPSTFETTLDDPNGGRTEDGTGAMGGLSAALTTGSWTFALTYMDDAGEYEVFRTEAGPNVITTDFAKSDLDLNANYSFNPYFGVNLGYKRVTTEFISKLNGDQVFTADIDLGGVIGGVYGLLPAQSINSVFSLGIGYGILCTSDFDFSDGNSFATDDADGITWEANWNLILSKVIISAGYKFQDFEYDVDRQDSTSYTTKDLTEGFIVGIRYIF